MNPGARRDDVRFEQGVGRPRTTRAEGGQSIGNLEVDGAEADGRVDSRQEISYAEAILLTDHGHRDIDIPAVGHRNGQVRKRLRTTMTPTAPGRLGLGCFHIETAVPPVDERDASCDLGGVEKRAARVRRIARHHICVTGTRVPKP